MSSSPPTCGGLFSRVTGNNNRKNQEEFSLLNCNNSRGFSDTFIVADLVSMAPKFGWWNVVDGAMLQRFSSNKPQSAMERWFRLEKKAAKVGKGLVKNGKGRKLVSQHWLEAIDPLHRYGHNLRFYFESWYHSKTTEPFFFWLDSGEGKDLELEECTKSTLMNERIRYLGPREREQYEVIVEDGKLMYKQTGELVNSTKGDKWIFVMSTSGVLYVGKKERGNLQHSSFLAGAAITSAGRLRTKEGIIKHIEAHSGHYRPTPENFNQLISILESRGADLTTAKIQYSSKEMIKPSTLPEYLQIDEKMDEGSLRSEGSIETTDDQWGHECNRKEYLLKDLRDLGLSGEHDIFKQQLSNGKDNDVDDSSESLGRNLATTARLDQTCGPLPEEEHASTSNRTDNRESPDHSESRVDVERESERLGSELKENELNHVQGYTKQIRRYVQEPVSLRDEEIVEEMIGTVLANISSALTSPPLPLKSELHARSFKTKDTDQIFNQQPSS